MRQELNYDTIFISFREAQNRIQFFPTKRYKSLLYYDLEKDKKKNNT